MNTQSLPTYRIVLIGDAFVGKTSLMMKYSTKSISEDYEETIGAAYHTFTANIDKKSAVIQVWDTAGQEKYRSLGPVYFRNSAAAIVVFDVTDRSTYENVQGWITDFQATAGHSPQIFLVGNKIDLDDKIAVDEMEQESFADLHSYRCFRTSARTGYNVEHLFQSVAEFVMTNTIGKIKTPDSPEPHQSQNVDSCC